MANRDHREPNWLRLIFPSVHQRLVIPTWAVERYTLYTRDRYIPLVLSLLANFWHTGPGMPSDTCDNTSVLRSLHRSTDRSTGYRLDYNHYHEATTGMTVLYTGKMNGWMNHVATLYRINVVWCIFKNWRVKCTFGWLVTMQCSHTLTRCSKQNWFVTLLFGHLQRPMTLRERDRDDVEANRIDKLWTVVVTEITDKFHCNVITCRKLGMIAAVLITRATTSPSATSSLIFLGDRRDRKKPMVLHSTARRPIESFALHEKRAGRRKIHWIINKINISSLFYIPFPLLDKLSLIICVVPLTNSPLENHLETVQHNDESDVPFASDATQCQAGQLFRYLGSTIDVVRTVRNLPIVFVLAFDWSISRYT